MFDSFTPISRRFSLFGLLLFITCGSNLLIPPFPVNSFHLEYRVTGGIGGVNNVLVINNESFSYSSRNYNFNGFINEVQRDNILNGLISNNFLLLREEYFHKNQVMDALTFSFTFQSGNINKKVTGHGGILPKAVSNLISIMSTIIEDLKTTINSGKVIPWNLSTLEEWPFSDQVKLSENVQKDVIAGKDIFEHLKARRFQGLNIVYLEEGIIYRISTRAEFKYPFEEQTTSFSIKARDAKEPFRWLPENVAKLANIPPEGIKIHDANYREIRDYFENFYPSRYIIDQEPVPGIPVYDLWLYHGNLF